MSPGGVKMPINLDGLIFGQIMPDNSGGAVFDTDLDGTPTQEDEFVSVTNTNTTALDVSGWQIWSDSTGSGAPDPPQDGLFHTFPPGTVLEPGETLWVINEITGTRAFAQEASEGGVESGTGSPNTNFLTEGNSGGPGESIALVDPVSGDYIVFNMAPGAPNVAGLSGFPGTNEIGVIDGNSVQADPAGGESYQYDAATDSYGYTDAFIPCFASGTFIKTARGEVPVETLKVGDLIQTEDDGHLDILWVGATEIDYTKGRHDDQRPVEFKPGSLGPALPYTPLVVSPQHRFVMVDDTGAEVLAPAIGLTDRPLVRVKKGAKRVTYYHIVLARHAVINANGVPTESFYPGDASLAGLPVRHKLALLAHFPQTSPVPAKARPFLSVGETRSARMAMLRPVRAVNPSHKSDEMSQRAKA